MRTSLSDLKIRVLHEVSQVIGQALDLDHALDRILAVLSETLSFKRGTVTLGDAKTGHLSIRASHGLTDEEKARGVYRLGEGVTGRIFRTAQPFVVPDVRREPLFLNKTGARRIEKGRLAFLGVPIALQGTAIGVLSADRLFGDEVSYEEDVRFLTILAALMAQLVSLNRQVEAREEGLIRQNLSLKAELSERYQNFFIVGGSAAMTEVQQLIEKVAPTRATVLLLGESGTGKTLVARILHELSSRKSFPFTKVNCASVPENLLESELFGHEKGAFTGATAAKPGRFEDADGGTIFLDEIGAEDLAPYLVPGSAADPALAEAEGACSSLRDLERRQVVAALDRNRWNQSRAARELGITLRQIGYKIKKFGLEDAVAEGRARSTAGPAG